MKWFLFNRFVLVMLALDLFPFGLPEKQRLGLDAFAAVVAPSATPR